jgi:hypothetical protein
VPANIVWRTERRLNDPDCADKSSPGRCYDTKRAGYERSRLGWAAQTLESTCYERNSRPFRYRACASGNIPGAPRRKTTSCPTPTR